MPMLTVRAAAATLAIGAVAASASAQEVARAELIKRQIEQVAKNLIALSSIGLGPDHVLETLIKSQPKAKPLVLSLDLGKDDKRTVLAFCNPDCPPVDIAINDPSGKEIQTDSDHPAVATFTAGNAGRYAASIRFSGCKQTDCDVGVIVFGHKSGR